MDELLREFLADAEELIETLFTDIQRLREKHTQGRARRELTARLFRHVHTLKGTAAAAGLEVAARVAHEFETLLDGVRLGRVSVNEPVLNAFDDAAHALMETLNAAACGETTQSPHQLMENLRLLANGDDEPPAAHQSSAATLALLPAEVARVLGADDAQRLREAVAEGQRLFSVSITFDLETFDDGFRQLSDAMSKGGELLSTLPGTSEAAPGAINFRLLYASEQNAEDLSALAAPFGAVTVEELPLVAKAQGASVAEQATDLEEEFNAGSSSTGVAPLATQVRVELGRLDELISTAHELMTETLAALDLALAVHAAPDDRSSIEARAARIHQHFITLEEQLIELRRVPLARTLERAARAGRQSARAIGKDVVFEMAGGEVQLDKSLVEAVSDPLLHLVRNAVGHGIETTAERNTAGKSTRGTVRLEAAAEGDRVVLKITDDGRGIDLESVARTAIEHGLIEAGRSVSHQQALRLIFRPGFSTAASVSTMSGRGVGLDVVERAIEQVGGEMRVWSAAGQGTTFEMIVPVALALCSALVVTSAGISYCINERQISEACMVASDDVKQDGEQEVINWRGATLPLVRLRQLLGQSLAAEERASSLPVIIVSPSIKETGKESSAGERIAMLVDGWHEGRAEVLVRRLGAHGIHWTGVSGAAELSDGQLALVLELPRLLENYRAGS